MAVLLEGISVIIKATTIIETFPGGWDAFKTAVPNDTLSADGDLVCVSFLTPKDAKQWVVQLEQCGLTLRKSKRSKKAGDIAIIDQQSGPTLDCEWIEWGTAELNPGQVITVCQLRGSQIQEVAWPYWWTYADSITAGLAKSMPPCEC